MQFVVSGFSATGLKQFLNKFLFGDSLSIVHYWHSTSEKLEAA